MDSGLDNLELTLDEEERLLQYSFSDELNINNVTARQWLYVEIPFHFVLVKG